MYISILQCLAFSIPVTYRAKLITHLSGTEKCSCPVDYSRVVPLITYNKSMNFQPCWLVIELMHILLYSQPCIFVFALWRSPIRKEL